MEEDTAYHESGHAFLATYLGGRVRFITIEPDRDDDVERHGEVRIAWRRQGVTEREHCEREVLVALAGPVAEMVYRGETPHPATVAEWSDDWDRAWKAAEPLIPDRRRRLAFLEEATRKVYEVVEQDEAWAAIAALADELLAHETLEAAAIHEVLRFWMR